MTASSSELPLIAAKKSPNRQFLACWIDAGVLRVEIYVSQLFYQKIARVADMTYFSVLDFFAPVETSVKLASHSESGSRCSLFAL